MATLITATVKYTAGKALQTQHGARINAVLSLPTGEEWKWWGDPDDPRITSLKKGQTVQLIHDGQTYKPLDDSPAAPPAPGTPPPQNKPVAPYHEPATAPTEQRWSDTQRRLIFDELHRRAGVLALCHEEIRKKFVVPNSNECQLSEAAIQKYAIALYADLKELW